MIGTIEGSLAKLCDDLDRLPLDREDRSLILEIVAHRLTAKGALNKKPEPPSLNKLAKDIFKVSHQRNEALGPDTCPDPEWNMLLDLVVAHTEERPVYVSSLCVASGVPPATAIRRTEHMADIGLLRRRACQEDKRRIWVEPTPHALDATEKLLRAVYQAG